MELRHPNTHAVGGLGEADPLVPESVAVLVELMRNPCITRRELERRTGITERTLRRRIRRLEKAGYVDRFGERGDTRYEVRLDAPLLMSGASATVGELLAALGFRPRL
ncbi:MAG TPA: winged helix-turn-helix transcriptional regulator [Thermoleophilaceae bacterium]|nr:winged helix-turn-helix transcriptional regulator [Thermoleophilaceae bacterium]